MILPYNCINTVLDIASTEIGLVYNKSYFQYNYNTFRKKQLLNI